MKLANILFMLGGMGLLLFSLYLEIGTLYLDNSGIVSSDEIAYQWDQFLYVRGPLMLSFSIALLLFTNIFMKMSSDLRQMKGISRIEKIEARIGKMEYIGRVACFLIATGLMAYITYPSFEDSRSLTLIKDNWMEIFNIPFFWSNAMMALFFFIVMPKMKDYHMNFDKSDVFKDT